MKNKWHALTAISLVTTMMLTGCGTTAPSGDSGTEGKNASGSSTGGEGSQNKSQEAGKGTDSGSYVTASLFSDVSFWNPPAWSVEEGTLTGDITRKTGLVLDISIPPEDGATKLSLMMVNGSIPDIISITDATTIQQLIDSGLVWELQEFMETYKPDSHLINGGYPEDIRQAQINRDGGWYAFASHMNSADNRNLWKPSDDFYLDDPLYRSNGAIMWNTELAEQCGIDLNEVLTEDQVLEALKKAKNAGIKINGVDMIPCLIDGNKYWNSTLGMLQDSFGAETVDESGNYMDRLLQSESKHALKFLNTLIREGYVDINQLTIDNAQIKSYVNADRVLCFIGNQADADWSREAERAKKWYSTGPIVSSEGTKPVLGKAKQATAGWISTFISKKCANPEAIATWLDYMSSGEGMMFTYCGYEGVDYNLDENGYVVLTEQGTENAAEFAKTGISAWWIFHNTDWYQSVFPGPTEDNKLRREFQIQCALGKYKDTVIYDSSLVSVPDSFIDPNSDEGLAASQIKTFKEAQIAAVVMAANDEAFEKEYNNMITKLKELGIEKLDGKKNEWVQEQYKLYSSKVEKVN